MKKIKKKLIKGIEYLAIFALSIAVLIIVFKLIVWVLKIALPICVILFLMGAIVEVAKYIKKCFQMKKDYKNNRKELQKKYQKQLEKQLIYTEKRLDGLSKLKGENGEIIYAEEYIPITESESMQDAENKLVNQIVDLSVNYLEATSKL